MNTTDRLYLIKDAMQDLMNKYDSTTLVKIDELEKQLETYKQDSVDLTLMMFELRVELMSKRETINENRSVIDDLQQEVKKLEAIKAIALGL